MSSSTRRRLVAIAEDLWAFEDDLALPLGLVLPTRTTVVRLPGGRLVVCSPLRIDDALAREIEALGKVAFLVAPSCIHYLFLKGAIERWPSARVLGAPGLEKKKLVADVTFEPLPATGAIDAFDGELVVRRIGGAPYIGEHVFLHPKTRTLLVTDLVFNVREAPAFGTRFFLKLVGAYGGVAQGWEWRLFIKERPLVVAAVSEMLSWDFDRLVVGHGDVVESGARPLVESALAYLGASSRATAARDDVSAA